ncbi:hypothetical protein HYC85_011383 [Camellia sinensis]|uniref:RING-type domain-containing protein n=1 Tax=Camellia sinensis TaxID=4442 RepID=A0A7J7H8W7_CAMSI|nr:hypothetical protein HYC85_011383 [Camellia sinensis]
MSVNAAEAPQRPTWKSSVGRTPAVRFESVCEGLLLPEQECSVCLTDFEPDAEINHLPCGHVFHKMCLEKWLKYLERNVPTLQDSDVAPGRGGGRRRYSSNVSSSEMNECSLRKLKVSV